MRCVLVGVSVVGVLWFTGCASPPVAQPWPNEVARADRELLQGCYDCLIAARAGYHRLGVGPNRLLARQRLFEVDLLLALREKELDLPASDAIGEARRIATELPRELEAERHVALVDTLSGNPPGESRHEVLAAAAQRALSPDERKQVRVWLSRGRMSAALRAYLRLALDCNYPVDGRAAPPSADVQVYASPLLAYRAAICSPRSAAALAAVREREPRFVETSLFIANVELAVAVREGPGQAGAHLAEVRARFPASPAISYLSGTYEALVENCPDALPHYDRALVLLPAHDRAQLGRVICLTNLGRHADAIAGATRLLELDDDGGADAYYWRARNRDALHQLDDADRDIAAARAVTATADILGLAGVIAYEQADLDRAEADLTEAIGAGGDCTARWYLALVHRQRKRWPASAHAFEDATACYRDRASGTRDRFEALEARADLDPGYRARAAASLQASIDADAKQQHVAALLAATSFAAGGDLAAAGRLIDLAGEDPALAAEVSKVRARLARPPGGAAAISR